MASSIAVRDPGAALWNDLSSTPDRVGGGQHQDAVRKSDAQYGIKEVQALRSVDIIAPAELAELAEPLVKLFSGEITSGDHLRLPQLTSHDGPSMQAALSRILAVDTRTVGGDRDAVVKEEKMRRVLTALQYASSEIQMKANIGNADRY